jgi:hypothetical protein
LYNNIEAAGFLRQQQKFILQGERVMRICTTDPIMLNDVTDTEIFPFVNEGGGEGALKVRFETQQNRDESLPIELHGSIDLSGLEWTFDAMAENTITGSIN